MKRLARDRFRDLVSVALGALFLAPGASAGGHPMHPYRYSVVDIPVSLAEGTIRTPEFSPVTHYYTIMLQVQKPLPFKDMQCMIGVKDGADDFKDCSKEPLVDAEWTVLSEGQVVSHGESSGFGAAKFTKDNIFRFLGNFPALAGKKYVVEVKFTKDGTPLNVADPHLIITKQGEE